MNNKLVVMQHKIIMQFVYGLILWPTIETVTWGLSLLFSFVRKKMTDGRPLFKYHSNRIEKGIGISLPDMKL